MTLGLMSKVLMQQLPSHYMNIRCFEYLNGIKYLGHGDECWSLVLQMILKWIDTGDRQWESYRHEKAA
jgi:hypothetical protein